MKEKDRTINELSKDTNVGRKELKQKYKKKPELRIDLNEKDNPEKEQCDHCNDPITFFHRTKGDEVSRYCNPCAKKYGLLIRLYYPDK